MATINDLLQKSTDDLEKMSEEEKRIYLLPIISLEPKAIPRPLGSIEEQAEGEDSDIPIKNRGTRKKRGTKKSFEAELKEMFE